MSNLYIIFELAKTFRADVRYYPNQPLQCKRGLYSIFHQDKNYLQNENFLIAVYRDGFWELPGINGIFSDFYIRVNDPKSDIIFEYIQTHEDVQKELIRLEAILAVRFNLTGDISAKLIEMDRQGILIEDEVVWDWQAVYGRDKEW